MTILFCKSVEEGQLPELWKLGHITPIHKKGSRRSPGNYRPVSLTSVIAKLLESIIRDAIVEHMLINNLFADNQHGFVPGRSCMSQLLVVMEEWTKILQHGEQIDVLYLDFKKAFDSVPHQRLLSKLEGYGIQGNLLKWINCFLTGRKQRVVIEGEVSEWSEVKSGIPQGSVLGPILFVIFINDLPEAVRSTCRIFADDTKVYRNVTSAEGPVSLQTDLDSLVEWSDLWQLPFNSDKCHSMHLGYNNPNHVYHMGDKQLDQSNHEKDLGVLIDNQLKFHVHTTTACNKANQILAIARRSFEFLDEVTVPLLYSAMVRPHLEYGNTIWGPHYKLDQLAVEKVQRRATKLVPGLHDVPYCERLQRLSLPSLHYRRRRGDMIQVYKIKAGVVRLDQSIFFQDPPSSLTRGHKWKIFKNHAQKDVRRHTFSCRVVDDWNALPASVIDAKTVNEFKACIDRHWRNERYVIPH